MPLVLVALLAAPATASGSFVEYRPNYNVPDPAPWPTVAQHTLVYTADPGETNDLIVTKGNDLRVRDAGATIRTGRNCVREGPEVVCTATPGTYSRSGTTGTVDLGDGDDTATIPTDFALLGGPGDDRLTGGSRIDGGPGGDTMTATEYTGYTTLSYAERTAAVRITFDDLPNDGEAGEGDDVRGRFATIAGGPGDDRLSLPAETPSGAGGQAWAVGNGGNDHITGGSGADRLAGNAGDDVIEGNAGDDQFDGGAGADRIRGGLGTDTFSSGFIAADITITPDDQPNDGAPGEGDDIGSDIENFETWSGDDRVTGTDGPNLIQVGEGDDIVFAGGGDDDVKPGTGGADVVDGGPGRDAIRDAVESADTIRTRDGEADAFICFPNARPQIEADPFENAPGCSSTLTLASRFHKLRPSRRGAVSLGAVCIELLPRPCRGEIRLIARKGGTVMARALYDVPATGARHSVRLRLTPRGKATLQRRRRVPFDVIIRPADATYFAPEATVGRGALVK